MDTERLESAVPEGEALRYAGNLRTGGSVGFTDERLLVIEEEAHSVELGSVDEVRFQDLDYFDAVLGVVLVGFGLYSLQRSIPLGLLFAGAGIGSMYLTYRKREKASVIVHNRAKPLVLYPEDGQGFYSAFERALDTYRARVEE